MELPDASIPFLPSSEYALIMEDDDYPKTDFTQMQFRGPLDTQALAAAYDEAIAQVPVFCSHLIHRRKGFFHTPYWVLDPEVKNRLVIEDCRHMAGDPFDPMEFSTRYHALRTRRRINLAVEFPFNGLLLRVGDDRYIYSVVYHHSCMDPAKYFVVLNTMLANYHERIKGEKPAWYSSNGLGGLRRSTNPITPIPMGRFAAEQFADIWFKNPRRTVSQIASPRFRDYRSVKGRHSLRTVIDDPKLLEGMSRRAKRRQATLNDLLLACGRKAITQWNKDHDQKHERMRMMLVTSLRGRKGFALESGGAAISMLNLVSKGHSDADLDHLIDFFREIRTHQLDQGYDIQINAMINKFIQAFRVLSLPVRQKLAMSIIEGTPCPFYVSNVGVYWPMFKDGHLTMDSEILGAGDFLIEDIHSSASIFRDIGMGLTVRTHNRRFYMNFVCDRFRFTQEQAVELKERIVSEFINAIS